MNICVSLRNTTQNMLYVLEKLIIFYIFEPHKIFAIIQIIYFVDMTLNLLSTFFTQNKLDSYNYVDWKCNLDIMLMTSKHK